jgi:hypothetical protein
MTILILLTICINPENAYSLKEKKTRLEQYVNGIKRFLQYNNYKNDNVDIYITDNTIEKNHSLPSEILDILSKNINIITCMNNNYGKYNKGAGLIEQWLYNKELIKKYNWLIHFEPRQLLESNYFIESFFKNKRNLFTLNKNTKHFNTGLFCIETKYLLNYIHSVNLDNMVKNYISIEDHLYSYFNNKKINYDILDKMDLLWFNNIENKIYHW